MRRLFGQSMLICCVLTVSACGTVPGMADFGAMKNGTQVTQDQMAQIVDNMTTQAQVVGLLGQPSRKLQVGKTEVWEYDFTQIGQAVIGRNLNETTSFVFNKQNIVVSHFKTAGSKGTSSNPLLKAAGM